MFCSTSYIILIYDRYFGFIALLFSLSGDITTIRITHCTYIVATC